MIKTVVQRYPLMIRSVFAKNQIADFVTRKEKMIQTVLNIQNGQKFFKKEEYIMKKSIIFLLLISILINLIGCSNASSTEYYLNCSEITDDSDVNILTVYFGETYTLNVDTNDEYVKYYSSDTSVATVTDDGVIKGVADPLDYDFLFPRCTITIETPHAGTKELSVWVEYKELPGGSLLSNFKGNMYTYSSEGSIKINASTQYIGRKTINKCSVRILVSDSNDNLIYTMNKSESIYDMISTTSDIQYIILNGPINQNEYISLNPYLYLGDECNSYFKVKFIYFFEFADGSYAFCHGTNYFEHKQ